MWCWFVRLLSLFALFGHVACERSQAQFVSSKPAMAPPNGHHNIPEEALVQQMLASAPRFKDRYVLQGDLLLSEAEVRDYVRRARVSEAARPPRLLSMPRIPRCVQCFDEQICEPQLTQLLGKQPNGDLSAVCQPAIRRVVHRDYDELGGRGGRRWLGLRRALGKVQSFFKLGKTGGAGKKTPRDADPSELLQIDASDLPERYRSALRAGERQPSGIVVHRLVGALMPDSCKLSTWLNRSDLQDVSQDVYKITFSVDSISNGSSYESIASQAKIIATEWNELCKDCVYQFEYVSRYDSDRSFVPSPNTAAFAVQTTKALPAMALSFLPHDPWPDHVLQLSERFSVLNDEQKQRGILRHEFGHILGLRHEHIRETCRTAANEDPRWVPLSEYDPHSVMHYDCTDIEQGEYNFSDIDRRTIPQMYAKQKLYIDKLFLRRELERDEKFRALVDECGDMLLDLDVRRSFELHMKSQKYMQVK